ALVLCPAGLALVVATPAWDDAPQGTLGVSPTLVVSKALSRNGGDMRAAASDSPLRERRPSPLRIIALLRVFQCSVVPVGLPASSVRDEHCPTVTDLSGVGPCPAGQASKSASQSRRRLMLRWACTGFVPRKAGDGCQDSAVGRCPAGHTWRFIHTRPQHGFVS
ncbi:hypothetical protein, partial [Allorhodopirellula solitaria]|uniref:hypothetical protein n=1 Tax=Allorhodopirellula solitaria TaxID=2527987 RepID=UPI001648E3AF